MDRTIPYFKERIFQDAVSQGKRVLISSSENAIRGLLMHLCEIPEEEITGLEIPNGLPLIFDVKSKCVKLLDDGSGRDPLEVYNFGKAAAYLFRPCQNEDGSPDEVRKFSDESTTVVFVNVSFLNSARLVLQECNIHFDSGRVPLTKEEQETIDLIKRGSPTGAPVEV
jgi:hypothetical protein